MKGGKPKGGQPTGGGWKASLAAVLKAHNSAKVDGSVASYATRDKRADVLYAGFKLVAGAGLQAGHGAQLPGQAHGSAGEGVGGARVVGVHPAKPPQHVPGVRGLGWEGGHGGAGRAVRQSGGRVALDASPRRTSPGRRRGWMSQAKLAEVAEKDARVGLQMALQAIFGLRAREAMQLRPHMADKGPYLALTVGTKGGRDRVVPIDTPEKRELIDKAKTFAASKLASTSDPNKTLAQVKNHYYHVLRSCGITRAEGLTSHGLRHGYANDRYQQITGDLSPVRGGRTLDTESDQAARLEIAEELGHSRGSVTTHYLGR
jgi:hypothetical protein